MKIETGGTKTAIVEYGNDLDTEQYFSGFPKRNLDTPLSQDREDMSHPDYYKTTGWNLNNIPRLKTLTVLQYIY